MVPGAQSDRESGRSDIAADQSARVDSGGDHILWDWRQSRSLPDLSLRILSDRGLMRRRSGERASNLSTSRSQLWLVFLTDPREGSFSCCPATDPYWFADRSWGRMAGGRCGGDDCRRLRARLPGD